MSGDCDGLIAFFRARLDEDEAAAKAAWPGPWDLETEVGGFGPVACVLMPIPQHKSARTGLTSYTPLGTQDADTAAHIARHDPARALREVEAGRMIIAQYERALAKAPGNIPLLNTLIRIVRAKVAVYSGHPDYRQEWKP